MRWKVQVQSSAVYFVEAANHEVAASKGIALAESGVRPAYKIETTADSECFSEAVISKMRQRESSAHEEAER